MFSRKIKFAIFVCSPAKFGAAHCRTFFARTKKGAKKVRGGCAHPLDSRGRRKTPATLSAPQVLRRYWKFHSMWKRKNSQFVFTPYRHRANTSVFFGSFLVLVILGVGFMSEFSCLNLWHENGHGFAED